MVPLSTFFPDARHDSSWRRLCSVVGCWCGRYCPHLGVFLDQRLDAAALIGIGLIVAGVVVLRLFSDASIE